MMRRSTTQRSLLETMHSVSKRVEQQILVHCAGGHGSETVLASQVMFVYSYNAAISELKGYRT